MCFNDKNYLHFILSNSKKIAVVKYKDKGNLIQITISLGLTLFLAVFFTFFQGFEYFEAPFTILDGVYGSTFFMLTGFHGFHVIVGTLFLLVCTFRNYYGHFSTTHHIGFEGAV